MKKSEIQKTHIKIIHCLDELYELQIQNHCQYKEYIEKNKANKTNKVFGLDSFYYQSRLFDLELKQLKEHYSFVNNRIYCDYYKLYGMVKTFYKENFKLEPKKRNYMPYKDLEPFKQYEFSDSMNLNQDILDMIQTSMAIIYKKEEEEVIDIHTLKRINIDNYIYNNRYNNESLKTKVELYEKYLNSYHIYHMSFLIHLLDKIRLLFGQNTQTMNMRQLEGISKSEPIHEFVSVSLSDTSVEVKYPVKEAVEAVKSPNKEPVEAPVADEIVAEENVAVEAEEIVAQETVAEETVAEEIVAEEIVTEEPVAESVLEQALESPIESITNQTQLTEKETETPVVSEKTYETLHEKLNDNSKKKKKKSKK